MPGLISDCQRYFHSTSLYEVLGVLTELTVRKAFYKMSLLHHPDRQSEATKTEATVRFQVLSKVYAILADCEKRQTYDETGVVDEEDAFEDKSYDDWVKYWELLFPRVTSKQIDDFFTKYRDSQQELDDLASVYERCKGDMDVIMETMLCASHQDEPRLRGLIDKLIKEGRVSAHDAYVNENPKKAARRAKLAEKEQKLFAREQKKNKKAQQNKTDDMDSLASAIMANRERHVAAADKLLDRLTAKYCQPSTKTKAPKRQSLDSQGKQSAKRAKK